MMAWMKAVVFSEYGSPDVLALSDVALPVPRDGEVLIRIHATTVTAAECLMRQGRPIWGRIIIGLRKPRKGIRTLGMELAGEVTAVGPGVRRFKSGDQVDYTATDFTVRMETYDVIFDTVGRSSFTKCKGSLTKHGCYISTTGLQNVVLALWTSITGGKQVRSGMSVDKRQALSFLRDRIEAGELQIVIDRQYPLEQIVQAHRYVDTGRKRGNVVITVGG